MTNLDFCLDNVPVLGEGVVALPGAPAQVQASNLADTQGPAIILYMFYKFIFWTFVSFSIKRIWARSENIL